MVSSVSPRNAPRIAQRSIGNAPANAPIVYTQLLPVRGKAGDAGTKVQGREAAGPSVGTARPARPQNRSRSAAPLTGGPLAGHDPSTDIGRAAAWLFATAPQGSHRISARFHQMAPRGQRSLHLLREGDVLLLQRAEERGTTQGVKITADKVLWNGSEVAHPAGDVDAASPVEARVDARLQQALDGLMQSKNAPLPFAQAPVETAVPARQVARPFNVASLSEAYQFVKAGLPRGFDKVVDVGESRRYRVKVDVDGALFVDALHAPAKHFVVESNGAMRFDREPIDKRSGPAALRIAVERMNAALQAVKQEPGRRAAPQAFD